MRSGGCAVQQQVLSADAAAVVRKAVSAARRRGHAQVTPLHVASAMLVDDAAGPLRAACLRSSRPSASHPLQCNKALELCFNVALGRLAAHPAVVFCRSLQRAPPVLSNALAAAFKRAQQASKRRGGGGSSASSSEGHQRQQAAGNTVELDQLLVSILDDPSVSRVMREAGFSSAEVKVNVEKAAASSSEQYSSNTASRSGSPPINPSATKEPTNKGTKTDVVAGDAARVLDCMASGRGKRCVAVFGESAEAVVKAVMDKVSKGYELQPQHKNLQLVPLSIASFRRMSREEVEARVGDLHALVRQGAGKGVVIVLEDLGLAAKVWVGRSRRRSDDDHCYYYCPMEHAVVNLSRLLRGGCDHHARFWLLAFGSYASYTTCRGGEPSLEAVLEMNPVFVPAGGHTLSLGGDSELTYCGTDMVTAPTPASVPSWFRHCRGPVLSRPELTLSFSSPAPTSSSTYNCPHCDPNRLDPARQLWLNNRHDIDNGAVAESHDQQWLSGKPNPGGTSNSASNSSTSAVDAAAGRRRRPKFTELTAENLKILCVALETRVPRHRDVALGVAGAVLRRRSGLTKRTTARSSSATWLLFRGGDSDGKTAVARELARLVFGSYDDFTTVVVAAPPATTVFTKPARSGSSSGGGDLSLKRRRSSPENEEPVMSYVQRLHEAIRENPHRVFLIDGGVERWGNNDAEEEAGIIKRSIATGTVRGRNNDANDVASLEDAIVVLSCDEAFDSWSTAAPSPRRLKLKPRHMSDDDEIGSKEDDDDDGATGKGARRWQRCSLDLNACAIDGGELEEEGSSSLDGVEIPDAVDGVFSFEY